MRRGDVLSHIRHFCKESVIMVAHHSHNPTNKRGHAMGKKSKKTSSSSTLGRNILRTPNPVAKVPSFKALYQAEQKSLANRRQKNTLTPIDKIMDGAEAVSRKMLSFVTFGML